MLLFKQQCYEYFSTYLLCESFFEFCAYEQKYWSQNLHIFIGYCQVAHQNIYTNLYSLPYKSLFLHILSIVRYLKICNNKNGIISAYGCKLHFPGKIRVTSRKQLDPCKKLCTIINLIRRSHTQSCYSKSSIFEQIIKASGTWHRTGIEEFPLHSSFRTWEVEMHETIQCSRTSETGRSSKHVWTDI